MGGETFEAPSLVERLFNRAVGTLVGLGVGVSDGYLVEVRGRRSGRVYTTPVYILPHRGRRFLVAPRGETQWVRNARAAGEVALTRGGRREVCRLRAVADADKGELLKAYLDRFRRSVQRFFPVPAGSAAAALAPLAGRYPVFELLSG
jgi:deazaflavin-dependent oxidoreductase (nitroreductase family)